jgi:two-component system nitrogen regulation sensor histidine kinase NtrY
MSQSDLAFDERTESDPGNLIERSRSGKIGLIVVTLAAVCGLATFAILTGLTPISPTPRVVTGLMALNLCLVLALAALIGQQIRGVIRARKQHSAGAALHTRIVALLSMFAAVPAVVVAVFAAVTLNRGLDAWFSERTQSIVSSAVTVAEAYLDEQTELAKLDVKTIANGVDQQKPLFDSNKNVFTQRLATITALRSLSAAFVISRNDRRVVASATASGDIRFLSPPDESFVEAGTGKTVIMPRGVSNVIRALAKLNAFDEHYLYVYRTVNPKVIQQLAKARAEKAEYDRLKDQRTGLQLTFAVMYSGVMFVFLLAAVWLGMWFADRLVEPVISLVRAARQVSRGELDVKVDVRKDAGDLATLGRTFNQMTLQLKSQRDKLVETNHMLDERRRFTEAVLAGASAGVLGLDSHGEITLANRSARELLGMQETELLGVALKEAIPPMIPVFNAALNKISGSAEEQVSMQLDGRDRNFFVRVTTEQSGEDEHGYVVTFDDITELVSAQRNSAWADIARRIAHEIKNPLTPIQLSAERLRRKYGKEITSDPTVFDQCTETIIRQVGDIGKMVDEFSSFARMPSAKPELADMGATIKEALVLQRTGSTGIEYTTRLPDEKLEFEFDRRLVMQALTNLVKNAGESIEARLEQQREPKGHIDVALKHNGQSIAIQVTDNGIGLPQENRARLTEPYMTTRTKGTGLGLAIVKRIMEEHRGTVELHDAPEDFHDGIGARVQLNFPLNVGAADIEREDLVGGLAQNTNSKVDV